MNFDVGKIFNETLTHMRRGASVVVNKGGTRSGKTWSLLQLCYLLATRKQNILISVVGETIPFLKRGAMRDFKAMLGTDWQPEWWNATDKVYTIPTTKSSIEFFSADNEAKVHGSSRDYLFVNECYYIKWEIYRQLSVRTKRRVLLDYNPRSRFWVDERLLGRDNVALIHSTYKDNPFLTARQIADIESYKNDANWWRVYGMGETGSVEGLVYTNWAIVKEQPQDYKREFYCIDFGFTNDPTAILRVRLQGGDLWVDELCYQRGMLNADIVRVLKENNTPRNADIVGDSAEQKSIAEINALGGFRAVPVVKGKGSVVAGITAVQAYKLNVTQQSLGTIDELRNYSWRRDINGNYINEPVDSYNHSLDALRYGVTTFLQARKTYSTPRPIIGHIC